MKRFSKEDSHGLVTALILLSAIVACGITLGCMGLIGPCMNRLWEIFQGREQLRAYVESWGAAAPMAFICIQAFQVLVAPIPGELTGAVGGFIFGAVPNIFYSTVGLTIGGIGAFWAARIIGLPLVKLVVSEEILNRFSFIRNRKGIMLALVLFTIPGFPKDVLSYILGISPMGFLPFVVVSTLGRLPGTIMLSLSGSAVYDENWTLLAAICAIALTVICSFFFVRNRFEVWLKNRGGQVS